MVAADKEEDSSDESSEDEGSQYNYEFKRHFVASLILSYKYFCTCTTCHKSVRFQTSAQLGPFHALVILKFLRIRGVRVGLNRQLNENRIQLYERIFVCCPARALQLVICRFLRFHRRRHPVVSTRCFTGLVRDGVKIPQDGNRANGYGHMAVVHGHVWRTLCSVCATGVRVAHPVSCNS